MLDRVGQARTGERTPAAWAELKDGSAAAVPHVVAWNLTRRCNLECAHCYISAGPGETAAAEIDTEQVKRIAGEILELNPSPMFILSGGEPLLRDDLDELAAHASARGATVVVGTNGTLLTSERIERLHDSGVSGVAVSVDSLEESYHDRFRRGHGSLRATLDSVDRLAERGLDFVVQTAVTRRNRGELRRLVEWSAGKGAVSFNAYFLVASGRGSRMSDLTPLEYEDALVELADLHHEQLGTMMVRAKCAPHFMRVVRERYPDSPILNYRTRCPCGVQYCRVTPDGKLTPCPYLPLPAGDLTRERFEDVWLRSELLRRLRADSLGGRCGRCEHRAACGGCRARAYGATGDYLAEDPSCVYQPAGAPVRLPEGETRYGDGYTPELSWSAEAEERMKRVPSFVRGVVMRRLESYARQNGRRSVTADLLDEVRSAMPVDFSKRKPFFLQDHD